MKEPAQQKKTKFQEEGIGVKFTRWIGSTTSLILHSFFFLFVFLLGLGGIPWDKVLLALTTLVSLEAIYLSIFIQMSVNRNTESLRDVEEDIDEIAEDVDEIQEDVDEIQKDIDEIQEDVDEISEEDKQEVIEEKTDKAILEKIKTDLERLVEDIGKLKNK